MLAFYYLGRAFSNEEKLEKAVDCYDKAMLLAEHGRQIDEGDGISN